MRITDNQILQDQSEAHVRALVAKMKHSWRMAEQGSAALDGLIEIREPGGELTGLIIAVQIKAGRSYLTSKGKRTDTSPRMPMATRELRLEQKYLSYFQLIKYAPVILIWFDPFSENCFWGQIEDYSKTSIKIPHVFDRGAASKLAKLAKRWHASYPELNCPSEPRLSIRSPKQDAFQFYKQWRNQGCNSPAFGDVKISLKGWNHVTRPGHNQQMIMRKLSLLGAAKAILETQIKFSVLRIIRSPGPVRILYNQTARVIFRDRADAIVSVITEKIGIGPHQFLSVFENRKEVEGGHRRKVEGR